MNLVKGAVDHLNQKQTPALTIDQPLSAIATEIQWLWPDSFDKNKDEIMIGVGLGLGYWNCDCIFFCEPKTCPPGYNCSAAYCAAACLALLCIV